MPPWHVLDIETTAVCLITILRGELLGIVPRELLDAERTKAMVKHPDTKVEIAKAKNDLVFRKIRKRT